MRKKINTAGFTLIEILVAILIASMSLLGLAGMQMASNKGMTTSIVRQNSTYYAYDILDKMRANKPEVTSKEYAVAFGTTYETPTEIYQKDIAEWKTLLASINADGSIAFDGDQVVVSIKFADISEKKDQTIVVRSII